jgi:hypothetical protein
MNEEKKKLKQSKKNKLICPPLLKEEISAFRGWRILFIQTP